MTAGRASGTLFKNFRAYVRSRHGDDGWTALLERFSAADRDVYATSLVSAEWYPVGAWNRSIDAYLSTSSDRDEEIRRVARHIATQDFHTVFKLLLRMGTIELVLSRSNSLWRRYFDTGRIGILDQTPRRWRLFLEAPCGIDDGAGQVTCGVGVCTWMTQVLELAGTHADVSSPHCRFTGSERCEYVVVW
jgi:hypothetical protein